MDFTKNLGIRIRKKREEKGFSQNYLANALNVTRQAISKWETGENAPEISQIVALSNLLDVTTDWLLGSFSNQEGNIEASIFLSSIPGLTKKIDSMEDKESIIWVNGIYQGLTESILQFDGIPIKYMGGGLLAIFTGRNNQMRAIQAAKLSQKVISADLKVALHFGSIILATMGYKEYAQKDISGKAVNATFRLLAIPSDSGVVASKELIEHSEYKEVANLRSEALKGFSSNIFVYDVF